MPVNYIEALIIDGPDNVAGWQYIKKYVPPLLALAGIKLFFNGRSNTWERDLHGKVYIVTGGTAGIGASLVRELAERGAQLVLLSSQLSGGNSGRVWVTDYAEDLRTATSNPLIYVEDCDLSSLYSVRKFATKWLDSKTPRRLDGVICLAGESKPWGSTREVSIDGVEQQMAINFLGHYHLLTLLVPCLKAQPSDRDVRVLVSTCTSQAMGQVDLSDLLWESRLYPSKAPWKVFGTSKLLLHMFAKELQRRIEALPRKDKKACNVRINIVNPGATRTPSMRRTLSAGSVFGLLIYLVLYPVFWLFLKSCEAGMQSYMWALCNESLMTSNGGLYIKECSTVGLSRSELSDEELQKKVFDATADRIIELEKASALERNRMKPEKKTKKTKNVKPAKEKGTKETGQPDQMSMFKSAFDESKDVYPDMKTVGADDEAQRNSRLRRLDQKYEQSRKTTK